MRVPSVVAVARRVEGCFGRVGNVAARRPARSWPFRIPEGSTKKEATQQPHAELSNRERHPFMPDGDVARCSMRVCACRVAMATCGRLILTNGAQLTRTAALRSAATPAAGHAEGAQRQLEARRTRRKISHERNRGRRAQRAPLYRAQQATTRSVRSGGRRERCERAARWPHQRQRAAEQAVALHDPRRARTVPAR